NDPNLGHLPVSADHDLQEGAALHAALPRQLGIRRLDTANEPGRLQGSPDPQGRRSGSLGAGGLDDARRSFALGAGHFAVVDFVRSFVRDAARDAAWRGRTAFLRIALGLLQVLFLAIGFASEDLVDTPSGPVLWGSGRRRRRSREVIAIGLRQVLQL